MEGINIRKDTSVVQKTAVYIDRTDRKDVSIGKMVARIDRTQ